MSVYPFIEAEKVEHRNVTRACELVEVSRSAFDDWVQHQPSRREVADAELGDDVVSLPHLVENRRAEGGLVEPECFARGVHPEFGLDLRHLGSG